MFSVDLIVSNATSELDCSSISKGMIFSCYSDMCHALGVVPARGNSLAAQKKMFSRYFMFKPCGGRKCKVIKVYDEPLPVEFSATVRGKYVRYIEPILCKLVCKQLMGDKSTDGMNEDKFAIFSKFDLFTALGLVNSDFFKKTVVLNNCKDIVYFKPTKTKPDKSKVKSNGKLIISSDDVTVFEEIGALVYDKWRSAIKAINGHGIIYCDTVYSVLDNKVSHIASEFEHMLIKQAEDEVLKELGMDSVRQTFVKHKYKFFCMERNVKFGEFMKIDKVSVYDSIKITVKGNVQQYSTKNSLKEMQRKVNAMIVEDFYKKIQKYKDDFDNKCYKANLGELQCKVLQQSDFCEIQERLVEIFVKI